MFLHFSCLATRIPIPRIIAADTVVTETHCSVQANDRIQGTANPNFITVEVKTPQAHQTHSWSWEKRDKRCLVPSLKHESSVKFKGKSKDFDKKKSKKISREVHSISVARKQVLSSATVVRGARWTSLCMQVCVVQHYC
jgi:hypothetical protein